MASDAASKSEFWNIHEIVATAYRQLPRNEWDFIMGGTETETTLRRNRVALDSWAIRPRVLRDVSKVDWSCTLLGRKLRMPLILAPIGKQQYGGGTLAVAKVAAEFDCAFAWSSVNGGTSIEDVASHVPNGYNIFQLYVRGDADWVKGQVERAVKAQCSAFCVTVDTAMVSRRERDLANRYTSPGRRHFPGEEYQMSFDWDDLRRLRDACRLPLIVKGISTAEDAQRACAVGVDAIYVSNHGGRQLDHGVGSIDALLEITAVVQGKVAVLVDGGFCRGIDLLKAVAGGASVVGLGRLHCLALAAAGADGVRRMLEILEDEIEIAMGLCGVTALDELCRDNLRATSSVGTESYYDRAFPLLALPKHSY